MKFYYLIPFVAMQALTVATGFAQVDTANRTSSTGFPQQSSSVHNPDTSSNPSYVIMLTMPVEFPIVDNREFNKVLDGAGFPKCQLPFAALGIGYQLEVDQFMGLVSYNRSTSTDKTDSTKTKTSYRTISLGLGYDVLKNAHYSLYGYGGLKFCKTRYLYNRTADTASLSGYLQKNLDHKDIANARTTFDLGLGFSYQRDFLVGIRGGVLLPVGNSIWRIDGDKVELPDAPKIRYQGYIMLTIGIGNSANAQEERARSRAIHRRDHRARIQ